MAFSPRDRRLVFAGANRQAFLWDCDPNHPPRLLGNHGDEVYAAVYHPREPRVATAGAEGIIRIWDTETATLVDEFREHLKSIDGLAFSPDGRSIASASHDKTVHVRDLLSRESRVLAGHEGRIWRVAFSADGRLVASAATDGSVRVWDVARSQQSALLLGHSTRVFNVVFDPHGRYLASASGDLLIKLWDPKVWNPIDP